MIDPAIAASLGQCVPEWNERLCEGLATTELENLPEYINTVMHCAFDDAISDFRYAGYRMATPKEQLAEMVRPRRNKHQLEMTRSDMAMYRFDFMFKDMRLKTQYLYIPFSSPGGTCVIKDTKFVFSPTITDNLFSVSKDMIFMPVTRSRITFRREPYCFLADNVSTPVDIYWARLHHTKKDDFAKNRLPQLMHYMFCQYGVTGGFKFMGFDTVVGDEDTLNEVDFPREDWIICGSSGIRPRVRGLSGFTATTTKLAVRRDQYCREFQSMAASLFYILDNCYDMDWMRPEIMEDTNAWKRLLTRFIWKNADPREALEEVETHLLTLNQYLDVLVKRKLMSANIMAKDFYELLRYIMLNFSDMVIGNDPGSVIGKQLTVVPQIAFSTVIMIFNLMFALRRMDPSRMRESTINDMMNRNFNQFTMMRLPGSSPAVSYVESASDSLPFKTTGIVHRPTRSSDSQANPTQEEENFLNPEFHHIHSVRLVTKSSPPATGRLNPNANIAQMTGRILPIEGTEKFTEEFKRLK